MNCHYSATSSVQANQTGEATDTTCDTNAANSLAYRPYFNALAKIYARGNIQEVCTRYPRVCCGSIAAHTFHYYDIVVRLVSHSTMLVGGPEV
jgi:hypothetical protein